MTASERPTDDEVAAWADLAATCPLGTAVCPQTGNIVRHNFWVDAPVERQPLLEAYLAADLARHPRVNGRPVRLERRAAGRLQDDLNAALAAMRALDMARLQAGQRLLTPERIAELEAESSAVRQRLGEGPRHGLSG